MVTIALFSKKYNKIKAVTLVTAVLHLLLQRKLLKNRKLNIIYSTWMQPLYLCSKSLHHE